MVGGGPLLAGQAKLSSHFSTESFFVGEAFRYEVLVSGVDKLEIGDVDPSDSLAFKFLGKQVLKNGDEIGVALSYKVVPLRAGSLVLPQLTLEAGGDTLQTDEDTVINVSRAKAYPGLELQRTLPDRPLYVGEPFLLKYSWQSPLPLNGFRAVKFDLPLFMDHRVRLRAPYGAVTTSEDTAIGLPASGYRIVGRYGNFNRDKVFYDTVRFNRVAVAKVSGEYAIEPASLLASFVAPRQSESRGGSWSADYPSYFNNDFFEQVEGEKYQKLSAYSSADTLKVIPLPDADKPEGFAGEIGRRRLRVTAAPKVVNVGDPITLTVVVDVDAFPEWVELPDISEEKAFSRQFRMPEQQSSGQVSGTSKTFVLTLRPTSPSVTAIPSLRLPYFDPLKKQYGVAESDPIPITVNQAEVATAYDMVMSGDQSLQNLLEENPEGMRANYSDLGSQRYRHKEIFLLSIGLPAVGFGLFVFFSAPARLRHKDPNAARSRQAYKSFHNAIRKFHRSSNSSDPQIQLFKLEAIVRRYMADKFGWQSYAHTYLELKLVLSQRGIMEQGAIARLYQAVEMVTCQPAATPPDVADLSKEVAASVKKINPLLV